MVITHRHHRLELLELLPFAAKNQVYDIRSDYHYTSVESFLSAFSIKHLVSFFYNNLFNYNSINHNHTNIPLLLTDLEYGMCIDRASGFGYPRLLLITNGKCDDN